MHINIRNIRETLHLHGLLVKEKQMLHSFLVSFVVSCWMFLSVTHELESKITEIYSNF